MKVNVVGVKELPFWCQEKNMSLSLIHAILKAKNHLLKWTDLYKQSYTELVS